MINRIYKSLVNKNSIEFITIDEESFKFKLPHESYWLLDLIRNKYNTEFTGDFLVVWSFTKEYLDYIDFILLYNNHGHVATLPKKLVEESIQKVITSRGK